jgi:hypothetical protein
LGGILQSKSEDKEWIDVLRSDFWKVCEVKDSILSVLKLSYLNLSPQQRQCFAYCSLYPKCWKFNKDELIQMWTAQGYLDCSMEGQCMEDVGNQFIKIFLMKSFFKDAKINADGVIYGFKMHDLMHDLATQVAGNDCCYLNSKTKRCLGKPVHVSVELDAICLLESLDASRLRTLIVISFKSDGFLDREKLSVISTFKYLRVLKLCNFISIKLCVSIEKLKHLRFLHLYENCVLESLHKSIGNLVCLQTIKVTLDEKVALSTKVVSKLINLRHLTIDAWTSRDKTRVGFGKLSIQQYGGVIFSKWLSSLTNITEISLTHCQSFRYLPPVERLPFLKSLEIFSLYDLEYIYYEDSILHESFFPSLKRLTFYKCPKFRGWRRMGDDSHHLLLPPFSCLSILAVEECWMLTCMPTFPNIKSLSLEDCKGEILEAALSIVTSQYLISFPPLSMLKSLKINETIMDLKNVPQDWFQNLTSLENLEFYNLSSKQFQVIGIWFSDGRGRLSSLQKITFQFCMDLKALPDWICNISSLQHIRIDCCRDLSLLPKGMSCLTNFLICSFKFNVSF